MPEFEMRSEIGHPPERIFAWHTRPGALLRLFPPWWSVRVVAGSAEGLSPGRPGGAQHREGANTPHLRVRTERGRPGRPHRGPAGARSVRALAPLAPDRTGERRPRHSRRYRGVGARARAHRARPSGGRGSSGSFGASSSFGHGASRETCLSLHATGRAKAHASRSPGAPASSARRCPPSSRPLATGSFASPAREPRRGRGPGWLRWDPGSGHLPPEPLEGTTAVIHLAGETVAGLRWTAAKKRAILESREHGTLLLSPHAGGARGSAPSPPLGLGRGLLRGPGRGAADGGERRRGGIPGRGMPQVGGGDPAGRRAGDTNRPHENGPRPFSRRRTPRRAPSSHSAWGWADASDPGTSSSRGSIWMTTRRSCSTRWRCLGSKGP